MLITHYSLPITDYRLFYSMRSPNRWQVGVILWVGVFAVSTAAIWIRLSLAASNRSGAGFSLFLAASRLIIAALLLLPAWRTLKPAQSRYAYYYAIGAGLCLAGHFAAWITSLSFTSITASTTLVTTNPIWVALLSWLYLGEKLSKITIVGILIALSGGVFISLVDTQPSAAANNPLLGNFLALIGAWIVSLYLILGREAQRLGMSLGNYVALVYTIAAIALFPLPFMLGTGYIGYPTDVYFYVLMMAIFAQIIGHTAFNWALRWIAPTSVTLAILAEPVAASLLGWVILGEVPPMLVIAGAGVLLLGVAIAVIGQGK